MSRVQALLGLTALLALAVGVFFWVSQPASGSFASVEPGTWDLNSLKGKKKIQGYLYRGDTGAHEMLVTQRSGNYRLPMNGAAWDSIAATVTKPGAGGTSCLTYTAQCLTLASRLLRKTGTLARCDHVNAPLTSQCKDATDTKARVLVPETYEVRANGSTSVAGYLCVASTGQEAWLTRNGSAPPYKSGLQLTPAKLIGVNDCLCTGAPGHTATEFFAVATRTLNLTSTGVTELHGDVTFENSCTDLRTVNSIFDVIAKADDGEIEPAAVADAMLEAKGELDVDIEPLLSWVRGEVELAAGAADEEATVNEAPAGENRFGDAVAAVGGDPAVALEPLAATLIRGASIDDGAWQIYVDGLLKGFALRLEDGTLELIATVDPMPLTGLQIDFLQIDGEQTFEGSEQDALTAWWSTFADVHGNGPDAYYVLVVRTEKYKAKDEHCPRENARLAVRAGTYEVRDLKKREGNEFETGDLRGLYLSNEGYSEQSRGQELYHLKLGINLPLTANKDGFSLIERDDDLADRTSFSCDSEHDADYFENVVEELDEGYDALADFKRFIKRTEVSYTPPRPTTP